MAMPLTTGGMESPSGATSLLAFAFLVRFGFSGKGASSLMALPLTTGGTLLLFLVYLRLGLVFSKVSTIGSFWSGSLSVSLIGFIII